MDRTEDSTVQNTSAITILSSTHGRMRRAQRLIEKRDLQAAVKYGKREMSANQNGRINWKCTYADIVYITDFETSTKEITSWAIPGAGLDVEKKHISKMLIYIIKILKFLRHLRHLRQTHFWENLYICRKSV